MEVTMIIQFLTATGGKVENGLVNEVWLHDHDHRHVDEFWGE